jgi:hypothetical protein
MSFLSKKKWIRDDSLIIIAPPKAGSKPKPRKEIGEFHDTFRGSFLALAPSGVPLDALTFIK